MKRGEKEKRGGVPFSFLTMARRGEGKKKRESVPSFVVLGKMREKDVPLW